MEKLFQKIDGSSTKKLLDSGITSESIILMEDKDLMDIGIEKGPRLLILEFIRQENNNAQENINESNLNVLNWNDPHSTSSKARFTFFNEKEIRTALETRTDFRNTLYGELNVGGLPSNKNLLFMVRIVCSHFFEDRILNQRSYPTAFEKHLLAKQIVSTYPQLKRKKRNVMDPDEVSADKRKFNRNKAYDDFDFASQEVLEIVHARLQIQNPRTAALIIKQFPHMTAYNGLMIQQSFVRMTSLEQRVDMANILLKCILLNRHVFNDIEDEYIQGALVVFRELMVRGCKRLKEDDSMSVEEIQAAPLIRWVEESIKHEHLTTTTARYEPHIACFGDKFKKGSYYAVYGTESVSCGYSSLNCIDVFIKGFTVLNVRVPTLLRNLKDFLDIKVYSLKSHSSRNSVNNLLDVFDKVDNAERRSLISNGDTSI
ncbi:uncharacterized protein LOC131433758 [Malaya genurostris]|uniref:uncharacterized protein LOC131433758 n=1 Tax=Malaya genurostris TaxID=325434 RepID=UPI0026F3C40A|nr:uncharacterized protein LOC131433758 [Malaya genurostris]